MMRCPDSANTNAAKAPCRIPTCFLTGFELLAPGSPTTLRRLTAADAAPFAAHIAGDLARLSEFLPWPAATVSVDGARAWLKAYEDYRDGRVIVVGAWDGCELQGGAVLFHHQPLEATIELGCWVVAAAEGRGLAAACCRALLRLARTEIGAERVEWRTATLNQRSRRLAERLGFCYEGTLRSSYVLRGARLDVGILSLIGAEVDAAADS